MEMEKRYVMVPAEQFRLFAEAAVLTRALMAFQSKEFHEMQMKLAAIMDAKGMNMKRDVSEVIKSFPSVEL